MTTEKQTPEQLAAEIKRLTHAYADAKLARYGNLGIPIETFGDPTTASETLDAAIDRLAALATSECIASVLHEEGVKCPHCGSLAPAAPVAEAQIKGEPDAPMVAVSESGEGQENERPVCGAEPGQMRSDESGREHGRKVHPSTDPTILALVERAKHLREEPGSVRGWLKAALECKAFAWDEDQEQCAWCALADEQVAWERWAARECPSGDEQADAKEGGQ